jgi:hypothetical protein
MPSPVFDSISDAHRQVLAAVPPSADISHH